MFDSKQPIPTPLDVYDDEFQSNLKIARALMNQIGLRGDRSICQKWIGKTMRMKSDNPVVKKNRNTFFRYMLSVMEKAVKESACKTEEIELANEDHYMRKWSPDKRTYMAAKTLPGVGILVYLAVAREPNLGWDHPQILHFT
ncbi:uncharacterized protein [Euwallacea fornicatus]|uniref:uncharacterized protein n=1 Tax=Euwallacea fornicatus TaxID=995702 RepID=UPI00338E67F6